MKFSLVDEIPHPRELVFSTHRDKLLELVQYLPNVASVVTESRIEEGEVVKLVNVWTGASGDIPAPVRPLLKTEHLMWVDRAQWDRDRWRCDWEITLSAIPEAVSARGFSTFLEEGSETVVQMNGEFLITRSGSAASQRSSPAERLRRSNGSSSACSSRTSGAATRPSSNTSRTIDKRPG